MCTVSPRALLAVLLLLHACSSRPWTPAQLDAAALEREFTARTRTVARDEALVLSSPYDESASASYVDVVRGEARRVRELFGAPTAPPLRFFLGAVAVEGDELPVWASAGRDGVLGANWTPPDAADASAAQSFAFVYVPDDSSRAMLTAAFRAPTIRHELVHAYAPRARLDGPIWFAEALARAVERMPVVDGALAEEPFPPALIEARTSVRAGRIATLLAWTHADEISPAERARRYADAGVLLCFLLERAPGATFRERAQGVRALAEQDVLELEPEWIAWIARYDALEAIRGALRQPSPHLRSEAVSALSMLYATGAAELATRAADELALDLLADRELGGRAFDFLYFFRAKALTEADLARLANDADPVLELSALALRARRGEPFDLDAARAALARIPEAERETRARTQVLLTPGLRAP